MCTAIESGWLHSSDGCLTVFLYSDSRFVLVMPFIYNRTIRFQDTDAAGVVYFANVLSMCHEAYEASLAASGINLKVFFGGGAIAIPVVHASVDFRQPMFCGDQYAIHLTPTQLSPSKFAIQYAIFAAHASELPNPQVSQAATIHISIQATKKTRIALPPEVVQWLKQWGKVALED
jgi:1,4-dihydroxy-2-naphthoyl-CoA hydrolase